MEYGQEKRLGTSALKDIFQDYLLLCGYFSSTIFWIRIYDFLLSDPDIELMPTDYKITLTNIFAKTSISLKKKKKSFLKNVLLDNAFVGK